MRMSAPPKPSRLLALELPVIKLAPDVPVALMAASPVRMRFSMPVPPATSVFERLNETELRTASAVPEESMMVSVVESTM